MKNIAFIGTIPPARDGISDHNYHLVKCLIEQSKDNVFVIPEIKEKNKLKDGLLSKFVISEVEASKMKFDLVHLQFGNSYFSSYVFKYFKLFKNTNTKIVVTLHDATNTNLAKLLRIIRSDPKKLILEINKPSYEEIINRADKVIVYSDFLKKYIQQKFGVDKKVEVFYIGAEKFERYSKLKLRKKLGIQPQEFILSSFGFITPRKGYETVIKGLANLKEEKNIEFRYFIVGNFNFFHYKLFLKHLVTNLKLQKKIIYSGYTPMRQVQELLLASDVIIQPRLYANEGASASLATALFSGRPVISSNVGGFSEYINDGVTGLLVNHSIKSYKKAINLLYRNKKKRELIGKAGLLWAEKNLTWQVAAKKHLVVYGNLLASN